MSAEEQPQPLEVLQDAARELIAAAHRALDGLEKVVDEPELARDAMEVVADAVRQGGATLLGRFQGMTGTAATHGGVEHIDLDDDDEEHGGVEVVEDIEVLDDDSGDGVL